MLKRVQAAGITIGEQLSYVFETKDNLRTYIHGAGPYEYLRQVIRESRPHVFFSQLGGVRSEVAAEIAASSGAQIVVPVHHDMDGVEVAHKRAQSMASSTCQVVQCAATGRRAWKVVRGWAQGIDGLVGGKNLRHRPSLAKHVLV